MFVSRGVGSPPRRLVRGASHSIFRTLARASRRRHRGGGCIGIRGNRKARPSVAGQRCRVVGAAAGVAVVSRMRAPRPASGATDQYGNDADRQSLGSCARDVVPRNRPLASAARHRYSDASTRRADSRVTSLAARTSPRPKTNPSVTRTRDRRIAGSQRKSNSSRCRSYAVSSISDVGGAREIFFPADGRPRTTIRTLY